jgi:hypothetical protein
MFNILRKYYEEIETAHLPEWALDTLSDSSHILEEIQGLIVEILPEGDFRDAMMTLIAEVSGRETLARAILREYSERGTAKVADAPTAAEATN